MYPLISIETVPIQLDVKIKNASLEYTPGTAEMEISRSTKGDVDIKSHPVQVNLSPSQTRDSFSASLTRSVSPSSQTAQLSQTAQAVNAPMQMQNASVVPQAVASYEATAVYAPQSGQLLLNARVTQNAPQDQRSVGSAQTADAGSNLMPQTGLDFQWEDGSMQIRYQMDKLNFDWKIDSGEFKFTPGDIEISVEQQPNVIIKYTGGPIYVPPSADPNYEPVDVQA